jgi:hypothetical protein
MHKNAQSKQQVQEVLEGKIIVIAVGMRWLFFCYSCRLRCGTDLRFAPNLKKRGFEWVDGKVYLINYKFCTGPT